MSLNTWVANGRLTKESELKYTQTGTPVLNFTIAVKRSFKNNDGEYDADFINCVMWGDRTEKLAEYLHKGTLINVKSRLQSRSYENAEGMKIYVTEAVVEEIDLLSQPQEQHQESQPQQQPQPPQRNQSSRNQGNTRNQRSNNRTQR